MVAKVTKAQTNAVYAAALVQGIALVTFPAASSIFTDPNRYDLSSTQYGAMFLPQVVVAIIASLLGAGLTRRVGTKRLFLTGLIADAVSMLLLVTSQFFIDDRTLAYAILLAATASLGAGFGLTVPALNTLTAAFHPDGVDRSVLVLNALLGLGTATAPVFVAIFIGLGFWWGLPLLTAALVLALLVVSLRLPLQVELDPPSETRRTRGVPSRFWMFAAFAVLYGICETMNGNWAQPDMQRLGASATTASLALTAFWGMVTVGRVLFAAVQRSFPARRTYRVLPFVVAASFVGIAALPSGATWSGVVAFGLAGLGCSALLPLTISFGQGQLTAISASVAGGVIAFYQLGYGIAALGAGALQDAGIGLPAVFRVSAVIAVVMGVLAFALSVPTEGSRG